MGIEFELPFSEELTRTVRIHQGRLGLVLNNQGDFATLSVKRHGGPRPIVGMVRRYNQVTLAVAEGIGVPVELVTHLSTRRIAAELHAFLAGCGIDVTTIDLFDPPRPHHPAKLRAVVSIEHGLVTCRYPRGKTR